MHQHTLTLESRLGGTPRDRIFDVIMRRIDAMQPHRAGLLRFLKDLPRRPDLLLALAPGLPASMARLLDAAELSPEGLAGQVRVQGLTLVWLATIRRPFLTSILWTS